MSSENLHAPRERLSAETLNFHLRHHLPQEELDAIDWYRQRADDIEEDALKELLLHNMREEMEHASMLLEWMRRANNDFVGFLKTYLFTEGPILKEEHGATRRAAMAAAAANVPRSAGFRSAHLKDGEQVT